MDFNITPNPEKILEKAKEQFSREADKYIESKIHSNKEDLEFITKFINPKKDWKILDIATGSGHFGIALAPYVASVVGGDITNKMLENAKKLSMDRKISNFSTKNFDVHDIPYNDETFDLVGSRIAPHHFSNIQKAIQEMIRVTKTRGFIFIQDTLSYEQKEVGDLFNEIERLRDPSHVRDYTLSEWVGLFEINGVHVLKTAKRYKEWPLQWWTDRMSTPSENVEEIKNILEKIKLQFDGIFKTGNNEKDEFSLYPFNGYLIGIKGNF